MFLTKLLFPKLYFSFADSIGGGGAPEGQPEPASDPSNGNPEGGDPAPTTPTDFIEVKGVKIPSSEFEALAKEKYKDRFEAFENREKWQAENTRKAQENAQLQRDAEAYRRLMAERQNSNQPAPDPAFEAAKAQYVAKKQKLFPDVNPAFFESQFEDLWEARQNAQQVVDPILKQQGETFEREFLAKHPKVQKGSPQYQEIAELIGAGVDSERAYKIVFHDDIVKEQLESAIKQRDEEAKRKLQQSRTSGTPASKSKAKGNEVFEEAWAMYGDK